MKAAHGVYNVIRSIVVTVLVVAVLLFALAYVLLSLPQVQNKIRQAGEKSLSEYLKTDVSIGKVEILPFNRLEMYNVTVPDQQGDSLLAIDKLGAGISLSDLVLHKRVVVTYVEIMGLNGHITRADKDSPTNLQFVLDAFKPKPVQPPKPFDVQVYNIVIRKSALSYDVLNEPRKSGQFDVNHIRLSDLRADLLLPRLKNNDFEIDLKRLSFAEQSGLRLKHLSSHVLLNDTALTAENIHLQLPGSDIHLNDQHLHYSSLSAIGQEIKDSPLEFTVHNAIVTPSDFSVFVPPLRRFDYPLRLNTTVRRDGETIDIPVLSVQSSNGKLMADVAGRVDNMGNGSKFRYDINHLNVVASSSEITKLTNDFMTLSPQVREMIARCGDVKVNGSTHGTRREITFQGEVGTALGDVTLNGQLTPPDKRFKGHVKMPGFQLGKLLAKQELVGDVAMDADVDATLRGNDIDGFFDGALAHIDFRGHRYQDITAKVEKCGNDISGDIVVNDPDVKLDASGQVRLAGAETLVNASINTDGLSLAQLGVYPKNADHVLSVSAVASLQGNNPNNLVGNLEINDLDYSNPGGEGLHLKHLQVVANHDEGRQHVDISSDYLNGSIEGTYDVTTLLPALKRMLSIAFPEFITVDDGRKEGACPNDLKFNFEILPDDEWKSLVKLPVDLIYNATISGELNQRENSFDIHLSAPYLLQGNKVIEGTKIDATLDSATQCLALHAQSLIPNKKGKIAVNLDASGIDNRLDANMAWRMMREHDYSGNINLSALLQRAQDGSLQADIDINPSRLAFNDTVWSIVPGKISVEHGVVHVDNFAGQNDRQYIKLNGTASKAPEHTLCLELNDVSLDYIFETLAINHVDFGGRATGKFYASNLFDKNIRLNTDNLHVKDITYNNAHMGDADIKSHWMNDTNAVALYADIDNSGHHSIIDGAIFIGDDSLDLTFDADKANIAFLQPFMEAFTSKVEGKVSGQARLFGNFHTINLEGDLMADTMSMFIDYTKVTYKVIGDSVHIVPDLITLNDITLYDRDGHTASLNGWLRHDSFHNPSFNFAITNARNLLAYDTNVRDNPDWYGTIYGNGSAFVTGEPGIVEIKADMESAARSTFTFVMSDAEQADNYNFITFRDKNLLNAPPTPEPVSVADTIPPSVREYLVQKNVQTDQTPSRPTAYTIDLQGAVNNDVDLIVVMDPVGGDRIRCKGNGNLRLTYNNNDELAMYGKYTLEQGNYNFTLQDVIIKDFTIREGSSISFNGDPYEAILDIEALYSLNANLKDLDESFANDPAFTRTNVPVHALLRAKGVIDHPDISFDLEFPSLTTDAYRKVKSVISTDDMMSRQIVYLLALNRFYTPEYMTGTSTNSNELTSIAASTISSQLSNILGKMSENWSIAPNFRSDKGDFTDTEFDLALSSQLLNNRLIFNGNFGYRDNTYNTHNSNFIGDFDLEYLLNRKGTLRLKAYNHFNDQNYYVRNALTTQGVGLVWKHDFDSHSQAHKAPADSVNRSVGPNPEERLEGKGDKLLYFRTKQKEEKR